MQTLIGNARQDFDRQKGFSLVEVLVALLIGLILSAGLVEIFINSQQSFRIQDQFSRLQENARFASDTVARALRQVGHLGCRTRTAVAAQRMTVLANPPLVIPGKIFASYAPPGLANPIYVAPELSGLDNITSTSFSPVPGITIGNGVKGSDVLTVLYAEPCGGTLKSGGTLGTTNPTGQLVPGEQCAIETGDSDSDGTPLLASDCDTQHIFRAASDAEHNTLKDGTKTSALGKSYTSAKDGQVMRYQAYAFFVRYTGGSDVPGLYRRNLNAQGQGNGTPEIVEGVENMQVDYGIDPDADGSVNQFVSAAVLRGATPPASWNQVIAVRVELTIRSLDDGLAASPSTVRFNGQNLTDYRLRKTFVSTFNLRNRSS